jgi:hypothetical protein
MLLWITFGINKERKTPAGCREGNPALFAVLGVYREKSVRESPVAVFHHDHFKRRFIQAGMIAR